MLADTEHYGNKTIQAVYEEVGYTNAVSFIRAFKKINGMTPDGNGGQMIDAEIPIATLYGFGTVLRSITGGGGSYSYEFLKYEEAPGH